MTVVPALHYPGLVSTIIGETTKDSVEDSASHEAPEQNTYQNSEGLPEGLYESLLTTELTGRLAAVADLEPAFETVHRDAAAEVLSRHLGDIIRKRIDNARPEDRVALANRLIAALGEQDNIGEQAVDVISPGPEQLISLAAPATLRRRNLRRPATKLSDAALLTNAKDDPSLAGEIRNEMASANRVDLLCAFIRWTGLRVIEPALRDLKDRGIKFRVITSTYMLSDAQQYIFRSPTAAIFPGLGIAVICLGFNLFGDALRDALDPTSSSRK